MSENENKHMVVGEPSILSESEQMQYSRLRDEDMKKLNDIGLNNIFFTFKTYFRILKDAIMPIFYANHPLTRV